MFVQTVRIVRVCVSCVPGREILAVMGHKFPAIYYDSEKGIREGGCARSNNRGRYSRLARGTNQGPSSFTKVPETRMTQSYYYY